MDRPERWIGPLALAYARARYWVRIGHLVLRVQVGQRAQDLERRLAPARSYQFITAWNQQSQPTLQCHNLAADRALRRRLKAAGLRRHPAWSCDCRGESLERGWLVLDLAPDQADQLARAFGQAGILYWQAGEPVRLRMQSSRPPGVATHSFIDWAG